MLLLLLPACGHLGNEQEDARLDRLTDLDADGSTLAEGDCNDADPLVHLDAAELCDGLDNDCDGSIDEDGGDTVWCTDADGDGHGDPTLTTNTCVAPVGGVTTCDDCDDTRAELSPGATELCDGFDNNCDLVVDDPTSADATLWYRDADGDGFGIDTATETACAHPEGFAAEPSDCDDDNALANPGMQEVCNNGFDDDCDGSPDGCGFAGDEVLEPHGISGVDGGYVAGPEGVYEHIGGGAYVTDVTADGLGDIVLCGYGEMYGEADGGSVHFWYGTPVGYQEITAAGAHLYGPSGLYLGYDNSVLSTDVDGDGIAEILIGGLGPVAGFPDGGSVMRFDPGLSGTREVTPSDAWITSEVYDEGIGTGLQRADGLMDNGDHLLVGADTNSEAASRAGKIYILALDSPEIAEATATIVGSEADDYVGYLEPPLLDLNADGYDDLVVSTHNHLDGDGTVQVFNGPLLGAYTLDDANAVLTLPGDGSFGRSVTTLRDPAGGGKLVVSSAGRLIADTRGAAYLLPGDLTGAVDVTTASLAALSGEVDLGGTQFRLASGDLDGDDVSDLAIGDPFCNSAEGSSDVGAIYLYTSPLLLRGTHDVLEAATASFHGRDDEAALGVSLAIGDANHDGRNDLLFYGTNPDIGWRAGGAYFLLGAGM